LADQLVRPSNVCNVRRAVVDESDKGCRVCGYTQLL
jgi:hypothetical protein